MTNSATTEFQPDALIAATFWRVLAEAGPRQAAVLRRCAIPHLFDAPVLAVLRERADGNERVLEQLAGYSFVRPVGPGRYAYQDDVRAALLAEWRTRQPDELAGIHRILAGHFAARAQTMRPTDIQLPSMTVSVRPAGEWDLWEREALYHLLHANPAAGLAQLRNAFEAAERSYRLSDAEALLATAADVQLDADGARWLRYLRARLARASLRLDDAVAQLETLLAEPGLDSQLAAAAQQSLGGALAETGQWARATELYRSSLKFYQQAGDRQRAAEVMLRLGEAYRGMALNTGGWYVPAFPQNPALRALGQAWYWLLGLPFVLVAFLLRRTPWALPRPHLLASYQNWLLTRIYRTAQEWFGAARAAFAQLNDDSGVLQADQQGAEILLLFGYAEEALSQFNALHERPAAQTIYRRLWLDIARASALIACGDTQAAQALLAPALAGFQQLGDVRGEAAALALQGNAAAQADDTDTAIELYRSSLARFRALRYTAAREQALYALRAWQRHSGPGPISEKINILLDNEPEKRYVARFPRSLLPLLQALALMAVPLTLLLATLVSPSTVIQRIGNSALLEQQTFFNLWNVLALVIVQAFIGLGLYAMVGLALMFFIRLEALEREQPDYLITSEHGIARYDYRGALALQLDWGAIRRWVNIDRRLWQRPMALFSLAFLEDTDGRDLRIDGITGWYNGLQRDIALHLRGASTQTRAEERGVRLGPSKSGVLFLLGLLLLLACIATDNQWSEGLLALPPPLYTLVYLVSFSGLPILIPLGYWFVAQPLAIHRQLELNDRWPWVVGALGLVFVVLYAVSGGRALPVAALNIGMFLWGAYALADAMYTLWFPRRPALGVALVIAALLVALMMASVPTTQLFFSTLSRTYTRQANYGAAEQAGSASIPPQDALPGTLAPDSDTATGWQRVGNALYLQGNFAGAVDAYTRALRALPSPLSTGTEREQAAIIFFNRARALQKIGERQPTVRPAAERDQSQACQLAPELCGITVR